ncbi:MAG: S-layer homology domain-containing protein [Clostridia bacterium]|nr:S-layer homology domain-containing protein [Clostridia bacterium]
MNKIKKCISYILSAAICFSGLNVFADVLYQELTKPAEEEVVEYTEKTYGYTSALLLESIGVENALDGLNDKITRKEFCNIMASVLVNMSVDDTGAEKRFSDVTEATEYLKEISMLSSAGYVVGYSNMEFKPDEVISQKEAICVMVRALGYESWADALGGYYVGYDKVSNMLGLTNNFAGKANELTRADVYVLIENFLNSDLLEIRMKTNGGYEYEQNKEVSYLNDVYDIYKYEGRVTDNGITAINSKDIYREGNAVIGDEEYLLGNVDLTDSIGTYVKGYYKDDDGERTLLTAVEVLRYSKSIELDIEDIESLTASKIVYEVNGKEKKLNIAANANYIYNGLFTESLTKQMLDSIDIGNVKVISYNNNNTYDVLIVNSYDVVVAESASSEGERISGKYNGDVYKLDEYDSYKIIKDGKEITLDEVHDFDILLILENEKTFTAYYTNQAVYGSVSGVTYEDARKILKIDGKEYKIYKKYAAMPTANINNGSTGTFYIVNDRYIVYFEADVDEQIGVLHRVNKAETDDGTECVLFDIFTSGGEWLKVYAKDKVKLNDKTRKKEELVNSSLGLGLVDGNGDTIRNPITFRLNKDGDLSSIKLPDDTKPDSDTLQPAADSSEYLRWRNANVFLENPNVFTYKVKSSIYFQIPTDPESTEYYRTQTAFPGAHDRMYTVMAYYTKYESKRFRSPDIVIEYKDGAKSYSDSNRVDVVKSIEQGIDEEDNPVYVLNVVHRGEDVSYYAASDKIINGLEPGDVTRIWYDGNKKLVGYRKVYNPKNDVLAVNVKYNDDGTKKTEEESQKVIRDLWGIGDLSKYDEKYFIGNFKTADDISNPATPSAYNYDEVSYGLRNVFLGTVEAVNNSVIIIKSTYGKQLMFGTDNGDPIYKTYVTIVTMKGSKYNAEPAKLADILNGDKILVRSYDGNAADIIIYR